MKFRFALTLLLISISACLYPQNKVKNLILMIPDGTSTSVLSLARWYKYGACPADNCRLAIDPHLCGLATTHNSDSPIGDSAPTGSTYATGYLSNTGFVATYPVSSGRNDLAIVDPQRAYHPLFTILEAAKLQGKSTGVVMTSQFTHATPADFTAHTSNRDDYESIATQMVHNDLNVVFGGGLQYLDPAKRTDGLDLFNVLRSRNYNLVTTLDQFDDLTPGDTLVYALFAEDYLPNDLDRNPLEVPSLAEMTRTAIKILSENPDGFFLMVEGSKIDWSAHIQDPVGVITEYLAFDDAVKEAMDFANRDGYTAVVVVPDHGTGGISVGNVRSNANYDVLPVNDLVQPLRECTMTAEGMTLLIRKSPPDAGAIFLEKTGVTLSDVEIQQLHSAVNSVDKYLLPRTISNLLTKNTYVGFTTHGHTGEDVMLAVYHPGNYRPKGVVTSRDLHSYMTEILETPDLDALSESRFCIDSVALKGLEWIIRQPETGSPSLFIKQTEHALSHAEIVANTDYVSITRKGKLAETIPLGSIALFSKPLGHFFIPKELGQLLAGKLGSRK